MIKDKKKKNPWAWIPTLYFAEGLPYCMVMTVSVMMYKRLGLSNADIAFYTSWLYLPWIIKPFWSPIVDIFKTKRIWVIAMQFLVGVSLAGVAFTLTIPYWLQLSLAFFWLMAFSSATHDIAADAFYMDALDTYHQSMFVGIRSTFYRISMIIGQGAIIALAGGLEVYTRNIKTAWGITMIIVAIIFTLLLLYHLYALPKVKNQKLSHYVPQTNSQNHQSKLKDVSYEFAEAFCSFFRKPGIVIALLFMLLYRMPEALIVKISMLFLNDSMADGGLGLSPSEIGFAQGTLGTIGLLAGGILGGVMATRGGLKKWLWPMVAMITIPDILYVFLSIYQPSSFALICGCLVVEQFGYGFGFTAYMLYMLYFCKDDENNAAHYAICTGIMALGMMLPGLFAGMLQESVGYPVFFSIVVACCLITVFVAKLVKIDPEYGKKKKS